MSKEAIFIANDYENLIFSLQSLNMPTIALLQNIKEQL